MSTLYRKVLCSERLPNKDGLYDTDTRKEQFDIRLNKWIAPAFGNPEWWLEELNIPDEEYVEKFIIELQKHFKMRFDVEAWKSGFKTALEPLTGYKK